MYLKLVALSGFDITIVTEILLHIYHAECFEIKIQF
jgi:hypothetical protein